jgi:3-isopropylmalate/(R)-2-methylmalate dehydratase small subunit
VESLHAGRCWRFGDNINTDLMWPAAAFRASPEERLRLVFSATRPDWHNQVRAGDVIVAGRNFGAGSGRPAPTSLLKLGVAAVVATTVNGLFLRNAVNSGLAVLECDVPEHSAPEGSTVTIDFFNGTVVTEDGRTHRGAPIPKELWEIVAAGGILPRLRREGYIAADG